MRRGVIAKRCSCGSFWSKGAKACGRCGSVDFVSWGFYVDTHPTGVQKRSKTFRSGFPSREEAERELGELVRSLRSGSFGPPSKQPLGEYLGRWLPSRTHLRPTTADAYAVNIGRYICNDDYGIGGVPLRALTRSLIQAFYADLERKGRVRGDSPLAPKAVHNVHMILRKALEDAVEEGLLPANPARRAHTLPAIHREMKTWTDEELASFLGQLLDDPLYALWRLAATTGMRRGELLAATWPGLDFAARRLYVTQALSKGPKGAHLRFGPPKTDRGRRAVPLDEETADVLREHRRRQLQTTPTIRTHGDHMLVFWQDDGRPLDPDSVSQRFRRLVERTGLPLIRFHDLRHTFATLSLKAGIPTEVVSRILGHKHVATTQAIYQHAVPTLEEEAISRFAELLERAKSA
jgi:integrase